MNLRQRAISLLILICWIAAVVCAGATDSFTSNRGYTLSSPAGWRLDSSGISGSDVFLYAPVDHKFRANVNVMVKEVNTAIPVPALKSALNDIYKRSFPKFKLIEQRTILVNGVFAVDTVATYTALQPAQRVMIRQVVALNNGNAYTITCTSLASNHTPYDRTFATIIKSIHWVK